MMKRTLIAASVLALASMVGPGFAQERTINGIAVPTTELDAVQTKCDELLSNSAMGLAKTLPAPADPAAPAAELPAAGASTDAAATESAAEAPVDPAAVAVAQPAPAEGGNMAAAETPAEAATIDLASLTAEICTEGGFTATTP